MRKYLIRSGIAAGLTLMAAICGILALLMHPQMLFSHHIAEGTLELWSDWPFVIASGRDVLHDVEHKLAKSPLPPGREVRRIFVVNSGWRRRLLFLHHANAGGLNYFPITSNVFIRPASIEAGLVVGPSGDLVKPPRTLAYYAAHEIGHSLVGERAGVIGHFLMPVWVREGLADYIALPGAGDRQAMIFLLSAGDSSMAPERSGLYRRYRLLVTQALQEKGWTLQQLIDTRLSQEEAEAQLLPPR